MTNTKTPAELPDEALEGANGGLIDTWPTHFKLSGFDGKGNDATTEGGFSEVSGLGTEITVAEYREGNEKLRR